MSIEEAKSPNTTPSRLQELSRNSSLNAYIAENPNTPKEVLLRLAQEYPEEFLRNPSVPLLLLEDPALLHSHARWANLLKSPSLPEWARESLARHPNADLLRAILLNPKTPLDWLERLATNASPEIQFQVLQHPGISLPLREELAKQSVAAWHAAIRNPNTPIDLLLRLKEFAPPSPLTDDEDDLVGEDFFRRELDPYYARCALGWNQNTPAQILEACAADPDQAGNNILRQGIACHPNTPAHLLEELATRDDKNIQGALAHNPNVPIHLIERLAQSKEFSVYANAIENPSAPVTLLTQMASSPEREVRRRVAKNPNTPDAVLTQLVCKNCGDLCVCDSLSTNPSTPLELVETLFHDKRKHQALSNPNLSLENFVDFICDPDEYIHTSPKLIYAALQNKRIPISLLDWISKEAPENEARLLAEASNPKTNKERLYELARIDSEVRACVLRNPGTPASLLEDIYYGLFHLEQGYMDEEMTELYLIAHPALPIEHLERLSYHPSWRLRSSIAARHRAPREIKARLRCDPVRHVRAVALAHSTEASLDELASLIEDPSLRVRVGVAENKQTTQELLAQLAKDAQWRVREATAKHPQATSALLEALSGDPMEAVRAAVVQHPNTPESARRRLVHDARGTIRKLLAISPHSSPEVLTELCTDQEASIRSTAEKNHKTPNFLQRLWRRLRS